MDDTTPAFEEWLRAARAALATRLDACAERVLRSPHQHSVETLVSAAERLSEYDPGDHSRRLAIDAFARIGRPDLARRHGRVPAQIKIADPHPPKHTAARLGFRSVDCALVPGASLPLRAFLEDCADHLAGYRSFTVLAPHSTMKREAPGTDLSVMGRLVPGEDGPVLALRLEEAEGAIVGPGASPLLKVH